MKSLLLVLFVLILPIGLSPDEAQYWTWGQALDWGYYSKPPGIAWQIRLTSFLLGDTALGVRAGAILIGFFLAMAVFYLAQNCGITRRQSFWAAMAMAFSPMGVYLSFAATTDGGSILFLTLAISLIAKAFREQKAPQYLFAGFLIFLSGLFKWNGFVFWPILFFFWPFYPFLRRKEVVWGILVSLLALAPSFYWNYSHEWATFRHVTKTIVEKAGGNPFEFLASQAALFSPCLFVLFIYALIRKKNSGILFCSAFPILAGLYLLGSCFKKIQPNWPIYLYPPAMVMAAWIGGKKWLAFGSSLAAAMSLTLFAIPSIQQNGWFDLPYRINPFRQCMGGKHLQPSLSAAGFCPDTHFLFSDKYQTASLLSFYSGNRAYFFNLLGIRKNQFSYWPSMADREKGKTGYFVVLENTSQQEALTWTERHYQNLLAPYFAHIELKGSFPLFAASGEGVKHAVVLCCENYLGEAPDSLDKY